MADADAERKAKAARAKALVSPVAFTQLDLKLGSGASMYGGIKLGRELMVARQAAERESQSLCFARHSVVARFDSCGSRCDRFRSYFPQYRRGG